MAKDTDEELEKKHRYFAATTNNRAWDLSIEERDAATDQEMLHAAHASAYHWSIIGTELNQMRATMLLAEVHSLLGFGTSAYKYAEKMKTYFLENDTPDWEIAFTHTIHAHAAFVYGDMSAHAQSYANAQQSIDKISKDVERDMVVKTFQHVPKPKL